MPNNLVPSVDNYVLTWTIGDQTPTCKKRGSRCTDQSKWQQGHLQLFTVARNNYKIMFVFALLMLLDISPRNSISCVSFANNSTAPPTLRLKHSLQHSIVEISSTSDIPDVNNLKFNPSEQ